MTSATAEKAGEAPEPVAAPNPWIGEAPPSEAGPIDIGSKPHSLPPALPLSPFAQTLRFGRRPFPYLARASRELGEVFSLQVIRRREPFVISSHPDHAKALFTAKVDLIPTATSESPLRPFVGDRSILTANGPRHMRQRRLLLPPFHGEAIAEYARQISEIAEREIDGWVPGEAFSLARRMQAVTLEVIMSAVFGIEGEPIEGTPERNLRDSTRWFLALSEKPGYGFVELYYAGRMRPEGLIKVIVDRMDRGYYAAIRARREMPEAERGTDVLSLLLSATDEDGQGLSDQEIRDELVSLVLAGHETTANSLAWTHERLVRSPGAYRDLRDAVRGGDRADEWVEATVHEGMRVRPVIPMVGRRVQTDWQLGDYVVPKGHVVSSCIVLLHHRPDLYPEPYLFHPERFLGVKPGTYTWIPFGGGTRRCLGAALAMAEQKIVLEAIARRVDLAAVTPEPERERHRNVTLIPEHGGRVKVEKVVA